MKELNLPFTLSSIKVSTYSSEHELATCYPDQSFFDSRSDFLVDFRQSALAVLLHFINKRAIEDGNAPGIRRLISVALIDVDDSEKVASTTFRINIRRGEINDVVRVDLPFAYCNIETFHNYKVEVRDCKSGVLLGEKSFHLFSEIENGKHIADMITPIYGGISELGSRCLCKAFDACAPGFYELHFRFTSEIRDFHNRMPEIETRIYYPNGEVDVRFVIPSVECEDGNEYFIKMPVFDASSQRGICYAEFLCLDFPIAGFVFSTASDAIPGSWSGSDLRYLEEYSLGNACERFRNLTLSAEDESESSPEPDYDAMSDDEFDQLLHKFISDELGIEEDDASDEENIDYDTASFSAGIELDVVSEEDMPYFELLDDDEAQHSVVCLIITPKND